jgi:hypothetical protein
LIAPGRESFTAAHDVGIFELDDYEVRLGQRLPLTAKARLAFDDHRDKRAVAGCWLLGV